MALKAQFILMENARILFLLIHPIGVKLILLCLTQRAGNGNSVLISICPICDSKWRLRVDVGYEANPILLYFGITEKSLSGLPG